MSDDTTPPRLFSVVTAKDVNYHVDTVDFLIRQEVKRRQEAGLSALSVEELESFRQQVAARLIVQGDALGAVNMRT